MTTEVESIPVADLGAREAADLAGRLEHDHGLVLLGEQVAGGQAGRTAPEDDDWMFWRYLSCGIGHLTL